MDNDILPKPNGGKINLDSKPNSVGINLFKINPDIKISIKIGSQNNNKNLTIILNDEKNNIVTEYFYPAAPDQIQITGLSSIQKINGKAQQATITINPHINTDEDFNSALLIFDRKQSFESIKSASHNLEPLKPTQLAKINNVLEIA
jgi:hypothetical protein